MSEHPIKGLMNTAMENLKSMIDVNTILGDPIVTPDGSVILTVSKVGFGFAAGGSEFTKQNDEGGDKTQQEKLPFGGGSGAGVSVTPIAFLVVSKDEAKMIHLDNHTSLYERMIDLFPTAIEKFKNMQQENDSNTSQLD